MLELIICRCILVPRRPGPSPPAPLNLPSKRWRDLILRVWHVDPLRVIAVIDDPQVVETILRHLGAWHDPPACRSLGAGRPASLSPPGVPRPCTYEPWDDVDPMPDYENVLTD
ncbi:MAG: hypothetical protein ABSC03_04920 [Verrucomicrobiota bacterium]